MPHRSISQVRDIILQPALTHLFLVQFPVPVKIQQAVGGETTLAGLSEWMKSYTDIPIDPLSNDVTDKITLLCSEASLPGSSILTHEINNDYTGQTERHAYRRSYDDRADFTFYVDQNYDILRFFHSWITFIVNDKSPSAEGIGINEFTYNSRVRFPRDYYTQGMKITKFEKNAGLKEYDPSTPATRTYSLNAAEQESSLIYNFVNAFPISINSIPVSYEQPSVLKCTVSFTYSRYYITAENARTYSD